MRTFIGYCFFFRATGKRNLSLQFFRCVHLWHQAPFCRKIVANDLLFVFANQVGWAIPEEYSDLFADLIIIGAVLLVACKYIKEAFTKFVAILNAKTEGGTENE